MTSSFPYELQEVLLDIDNISVSYGKTPVLKNVTAAIQHIKRPGMTQGRIIGVLGPSGCGKTTMFKVLSGLLKPDGGTVSIGPNKKPVHPGNIGVVAQNYPLLNHRTILGNLIFAAKRANLANPDTCAKNKLAEFNLEDHSSKYPSQLSGGQRQRVAIAQQLLCSEHYLVMDEPFSGLDVVALTKVKKLIQDVVNKDEKNTFIIVTHDVTSAVSICDTLWLMGRDRDASGNVIPGTSIKEIIDLIDRDICWYDDVLNRQPAIDLIREIKDKFLTL